MYYETVRERQMKYKKYLRGLHHKTKAADLMQVHYSHLWVPLGD